MGRVSFERLDDVADRAELLVAAGIGGQQPSPYTGPAPSFDAAAAGRAVIKRYRQEDASAWVALVDGQPQAFLGATLRIVTEEDSEFTYLPPRFALSPVSASAVAGAEHVALLPGLFERVSRDALDRGIDRVSIQVRCGDWALGSLWRSLGFHSDLVLAARHGSAPLALRAGSLATIRPAHAGDEDALIALAHEEQNYHARHTSTGTVADQPDGPTRREVAHWLAAVDGRPPTFVAELEGQVRACCALDLVELPKESPGRRYYPARYGYIGLTSVTADVRGQGIGSALVGAALGEFARREIDPVLLHYVDDNNLSRPFWQHAGFAPFIETLTTTLAPS